MKIVILMFFVLVSSCNQFFYDFSGIPIKIIYLESRYPDARKITEILEGYGASVELKETDSIGTSSHVGKIYYTYTTDKSEETAVKISNSISSIVKVTPQHSKRRPSLFHDSRKYIIWII